MIDAGFFLTRSNFAPNGDETYAALFRRSADASPFLMRCCFEGRCVSLVRTGRVSLFLVYASGKLIRKDTICLPRASMTHLAMKTNIVLRVNLACVGVLCFLALEVVGELFHEVSKKYARIVVIRGW